jgi:hypothetical protein
MRRGFLGTTYRLRILSVMWTRMTYDVPLAGTRNFEADNLLDMTFRTVQHVGYAKRPLSVMAATA